MWQKCVGEPGWWCVGEIKNAFTRETGMLVEELGV